MFVATVKQFQYYDQMVIKVCQQTIEQMILKAAECLYPYVAKQKNVVILCGKGNNGADGLALACLLKKAGQSVMVYLTGRHEELSDGCVYYLKRAESLAVPIEDLSVNQSKAFHQLKEACLQASVIVDGIFGTGLKGAPHGLEETLIDSVNQITGVPILAIDVPSGLNADNGMAYGKAIQAHLTVTFVAQKVGFLNPESIIYTGEVQVEDLGYSSLLTQQCGFAEVIAPKQVAGYLKKRRYDGYKGSYGRLVCLTGSRTYPGAAMISCGAALKCGCGLVVSLSEAARSVVAKYPEIVLGDTLSSQLKTASAILLGCGRGKSEKTKQELYTVLWQTQLPVLLDADGINVLAEHKSWLLQDHAPLILTPHLGEMARLLADEEEQDVVLGAIFFAKKYHCTIVLKGPKTMVTDGTVCYRVPVGDRAMATAGMGDALAGIIASFLAQGYDCLEACLLGAYLHGLAGERLGKTRYTVLATDIIELLPLLMMELLQQKNSA